MENAHPTPLDIIDDLAAPDQLAAVRRNQAQRLLDLAESLLQGFEAIDLPKDAVGLDRAAKALLAMSKTMSALHETAAALAKPRVSLNEPDDPNLVASDRAFALHVYRAEQGQRLRTLAERRAQRAESEDVAGEAKSANPRHHWP
jgi:hypothetical protein